MAETLLFLVSSIEDVTSMLTEHIFEESFRKDFKSLCDELEKLEDFLSVEHCGAAGNVSKKIFRRKINKLNCRFMNFQIRWLCPPCEGADTNSCVESSRWNASVHIVKKQSVPVGLEIDIKKITDLLLQDQGRQVIAVIGREGQGKTLLVQRVFNMKSVEERFEHRIWVVVSQKLDVENVLNQMGSPIKLKDISKEKIRESFVYLEGKRCLFVFDDVWDKGALLQLLEQIVFPIKSKHNILITSCNMKVAEGLGDHVDTHELNNLSGDDSRKLFFNHAS